ncbi:malate:quinone oxidoreductase, partial [Pseudomonas syringae]
MDDRMLKKVNTALLGLAISMGLMPVQAAAPKKVDVLLVCGGLMSATLAVWLNALEPSRSNEMVERPDRVPEQSATGLSHP